MGETNIEWNGGDGMSGNAQGALKVAAKRVGVSAEEYRLRLAAGEKWCGGCREWHPRAAFTIDRGRGDGLSRACQEYHRKRSAETYRRIPANLRKTPGPPPSPARDGDVKQARHRVNVLARSGRIPRPNNVPCVDCGHVWTLGERRHEFDHYLGYSAAHHEDVEVVCTTCHHKREVNRG